MLAEDFAKEFINDILETDTGFNLEISNFSFNEDTYIQDPNLNVLKQRLKENGFELKLKKQNTVEHKQVWQLIKL